LLIDMHARHQGLKNTYNKISSFMVLSLGAPQTYLIRIQDF